MMSYFAVSVWLALFTLTGIIVGFCMALVLLRTGKR